MIHLSQQHVCVVSARGDHLQLVWYMRERLVERVHATYYRGKVAFWLNNVDGRVDNADQRITQECVVCSELLLQHCGAGLTLVRVECDTQHFGILHPDIGRFLWAVHHILIAGHCASFDGNFCGVHFESAVMDSSCGVDGVHVRVHVHHYLADYPCCSRHLPRESSRRRLPIPTRTVRRHVVPWVCGDRVTSQCGTGWSACLPHVTCAA